MFYTLFIHFYFCAVAQVVAKIQTLKVNDKLYGEVYNNALPVTRTVAADFGCFCVSIS